MRLWHKDLIDVLPRKQLLGQWRECCLIAKNLSEHGTPNHILVNKILEYEAKHLYNYGVLVYKEMEKRGYKCNFEKFSHWFTYPHETGPLFYETIFSGWHNDRYLTQCFYNLQEKYDCGGISGYEFKLVNVKYLEILASHMCSSNSILIPPEEEKLLPHTILRGY